MKNKTNTGESGMALVMVMGVVAVTMLLIVHVMTICQVTSLEAFVDAGKQRLRYQAESASDHTFWMHLVDRAIFRNRQLGQTEESRIGTELEISWMADRREHTPLPNCRTYIASVEKTIRLDQPETLKTGISIDDTENTEKINYFLDVLGDYTDADSAKKLNGKDTEQYQEEGLLAMPRNGQMQYKEELYWLDGWQDCVYGEITIIPPKGKSLEKNVKPSFFAATQKEILTVMNDLTEEELDSLLNARQIWMEEAIPINDSLSVDLLLKVKTKFNFNESNIAQYTAVVSTEDKVINQIFTVVRACDLNNSSIYADRARESFSIWYRSMQ